MRTCHLCNNDSTDSHFRGSFNWRYLRAFTSGRFLNQRFINYQRFVSRASLHFSSVSRHPRVSISGCSGRAWRRQQSERSRNGQGASINDAKRRTGREKCPRRTRCSRRASKESPFPKRQGDHVGATIDQRLIKFWRERSSCAQSAVDSRIVFTPASIRCPIMLYHVLFPLHDEANVRTQITALLFFEQLLHEYRKFRNVILIALIYIKK